MRLPQCFLSTSITVPEGRGIAPRFLAFFLGLIIVLAGKHLVVLQNHEVLHHVHHPATPPCPSCAGSCGSSPCGCSVCSGTLSSDTSMLRHDPTAMSLTLSTTLRAVLAASLSPITPSYYSVFKTCKCISGSTTTSDLEHVLLTHSRVNALPQKSSAFTTLSAIAGSTALPRSQMNGA